MKHISIKKRCHFTLLILFLLNATAAYATTLNVSQKYQEETQWCWAACSEAILEYYGTSKTQTEIAEYGTEGVNTWNWLYGSTPGDPPRNGVDLILDYYGSISSDPLDRYLSQVEVQSEIDYGRPSVIRWGWDSGGGHIVVVYGIEDATVYLMDPWYGPTVDTYSWVVSGSSHTWTHSLQLTTNPSLSTTTTPSTTSTVESSTTTTELISSTTTTSPSSTTTTTSGTTTTTTIDEGRLYIYGHVVDSEGNGIQGIPVYLMEIKKESTLTNAEGYFIFPDLKEAIYYVWPESASTYTPEREEVELNNNPVYVKFVQVDEGCPITKIYGTDSIEADILRALRDNVLKENPVGREVIHIYYIYSPMIIKMMSSDEEFKKEIKEFIDGVLELITEEVE